MQGMVDRIQRWLLQISPIIFYILRSAVFVSSAMSSREKQMQTLVC